MNNNLLIQVDAFDINKPNNETINYTLKEEITAFLYNNVIEDKADVYYRCFSNLIRANISTFFKKYTDVPLLETDIIAIITNDNDDVIEMLEKIDRLLLYCINNVLKISLIKLDENVELVMALNILEKLLDMLEIEQGLKSTICDLCYSREETNDYPLTLSRMICFYNDLNSIEVYESIESVNDEFFINVLKTFEEDVEEFNFDLKSLNVAKAISKYYKLGPDFFTTEFIKDMIKSKRLYLPLDNYIDILAEYYENYKEPKYDNLKLYDVIRAIVISQNSEAYTSESLREKLNTLPLEANLGVKPYIFIDYVIQMYNDIKTNV